MRYLFFILLLFYLSFNRVQAQSRAQDSSALINFFNNSFGQEWSNKSNWKTGTLNSWYGVKMKDNLVWSLSLSNNKLKGSLSSTDFPNHPLSKVDFSNNQLTAFPIGISLDTLYLNNNRLTFNHLLPYSFLGNRLKYTNQDSVEQNITLYGKQRNEISLIVTTDAIITGMKFQWFKNGSILTGANSSTLKITCLTKENEGTYTCRLTHDDLPNLTLFRKSLFLKVMDDVVNAGPDDRVCKSTYNLRATQPLTGNASWTIITSNGEITDIFDPNSGITKLSAGANVFRWNVNYKSCPSEYDDVIIFKDTIGELPSAGKDQVFCDSIFFLNATPLKYGKGKWELVSGNLIFGQITNPQSKILSIEPGDHVLRWVADNGACNSFFDEVKITRETPLTKVYAGKDTALCGHDLFLNAQSQKNVFGQWKIVAGNAKLSDPNVENSYLHSISEGINKLEWTGWNSCKNLIKDTINVKVHKGIDVNVGSDTTMYFTPTYPLIISRENPAKGGTGEFIYSWTPSENLDNPESYQGNFKPPITGEYQFKLVVMDEMGCKDSAYRKIEIVKVETIDVPTLFTPNGDGNNDFFILPGIESYPNNELIVMDKLGQLVFKQKNYLNSWDGIATEGTYAGSVLPEDTYFYILDLGAGKDKVQNGFIVIKK